MASEHDDVDLVLVSPDSFPEDDAERMREQFGTDWGMIYLVDDCHESHE